MQNKEAKVRFNDIKVPKQHLANSPQSGIQTTRTMCDYALCWELRALQVQG